MKNARLRNLWTAPYVNFQIRLICSPPPVASQECVHRVFFKLYTPFVKTFKIKLLRKENSEKIIFQKYNVKYPNTTHMAKKKFLGS